MFATDSVDNMRVIAQEASGHSISGRRITQDKLWRMFDSAERTESGVLVGISGEVAVDYTEVAEDGERSNDERCIEVGEGLPIRYLTGIEPLGNKEWDQLADLQAQLA